MSRKPVIKNWQGASFKGVDFSKYVTEWIDTRQYDLATHTYLKRPGGENEEMGRPPHVVQVVLSYTGPTWYDDFMAFIAVLEKGVKGPLVHPLFGKMRAACRGFDGAKMNVEQAADLYTVPLVFIEDSIDTTLDLPASQGPSAQQQQVKAYTMLLTHRASKYSSALATVQSYVNTANAYAQAAVTSVLNVVPDSTVPGILGTVMTAAMVARDAIRADPADPIDAPRFASVALIEQVLDACRQLDASIRSFKPNLFLYVVPARTHIAKLALKFYGPSGLGRIGEIQTNNPGLADPHGIAPGSKLWMANPTT